MESVAFSFLPFWSSSILSLDRKAQGKRECKGNAYFVERSTCNNQSWPHSLIQKQQLKAAELFCLSWSKWYCDAGIPTVLNIAPHSFEYCSGLFLMNFSVCVRIVAANNTSVQKEWGFIHWGLSCSQHCAHVSKKRQMMRTNKLHPSVY